MTSIKLDENILFGLMRNLEANLASVKLLLQWVQKPIEFNDRGLKEAVKNFSDKLETVSAVLKDPSEAFQKLKNISYDAGDLAKSVQDLYILLTKPLRIEDKDLITHVNFLRDEMNELKEYMKSNFVGEVKFIAERIYKIEQRLLKIEEREMKEIELSFRCDGYELVKKPVSYSKNEQIEEPFLNENKLFETLTKGERLALIHRLGLMGEKKTTLKELGKVLNVQQERARQIYRKAILKCRHPTRHQLVKAITNLRLQKEVFGQ